MLCIIHVQSFNTKDQVFTARKRQIMDLKRERYISKPMRILSFFIA